MCGWSFNRKDCCCACTCVQWSGRGATADLLLGTWVSMGDWGLGFSHASAKWSQSNFVLKYWWKREGGVTCFIFCYGDGNIWSSDNEQLGEGERYIAAAVCSGSVSRSLLSPATLLPHGFARRRLEISTCLFPRLLRANRSFTCFYYQNSAIKIGGLCYSAELLWSCVKFWWVGWARVCLAVKTRPYSFDTQLG